MTEPESFKALHTQTWTPSAKILDNKTLSWTHHRTKSRCQRQQLLQGTPHPKKPKSTQNWQPHPISACSEGWAGAELCRSPSSRQAPNWKHPHGFSFCSSGVTSQTFLARPHTIIKPFPAPKVTGRCGYCSSLHVAYFSSPLFFF